MSRSVITANLLDDLRREGREIIVPPDALITPAARDWIRDNAYPVTWSDGSTSDGGGSLGVVGDFVTQSSLRPLRTELERIAGRLENFEAGGDRLSALAALKRLCCAVQCGNLRRGLVLTDSGVVPACVANKFRGVRACVGGGVMDIDEAVRELGINVLVIEYPNRTFHEMRQMVKRLVTGDGHPTASVGQAITTAETSNCGCALAQSWDR